MGAPPRRAGVVLAGGASTRFGAGDKALAALDGRPLLVHAVEGLAPAVEAVLVSCQRGQVSRFREALRPTGVDVAVVPDRTAHRGPAAGLACTLDAVAAPEVAVVAVDMPFVDDTLLDGLFGALEDAEAVVPIYDDRVQPLHAVYRTEPTRCAARAAVESGSGSLRGALDRLDVEWLPEDTVLARTGPASFTDVDTPVDLRRAHGD